MLLTHQSLCLLPDCSRKTHICHIDFCPSHLPPCLSLSSILPLPCLSSSISSPHHFCFLYFFSVPLNVAFTSSPHCSIKLFIYFLNLSPMPYSLLSHISPSRHPLLDHHLKMLLGPQCFAALLSTMINSESVVFRSRQNASS